MKMLTHTNKNKKSQWCCGLETSTCILGRCHILCQLPPIRQAKHEIALAQYFNNYQRRRHTSFSTSAWNVISSCDEILPHDGYVLFLLSTSFVRRGDPESCRKPECWCYITRVKETESDLALTVIVAWIIEGIITSQCDESSRQQPGRSHDVRLVCFCCWAAYRKMI